MNTLTKSWLQQQIAEMESARDEIPFGLGVDGDNMIAAFKLALASLESEPVAQIEVLSGVLINERWMHQSLPNGWHDLFACRAAIIQAEPVSEPYKSPGNSFTNKDLEGMIHGNNPQSNAYRELLAFRRNSQVTPDGWIPVSERMPEVDDWVMAFHIDGYQRIAKWTSTSGNYHMRNYTHCWDYDGNDSDPEGSITHWMPLPAAPQQEVNSG